MCVSERERKRERDRPKCPMSESWIPFFLKSVLIFHHWGFYGTDSIPEESGGQSYFSSKKKIFVNVQREGVGRRGRCVARAGVCHLHLRKWEEEKKKKPDEERDVRWFFCCRGTVYWLHDCVRCCTGSSAFD